MAPTLVFEVFTLFPEIFAPYLQASILQRALQESRVEVHLHNIRDWATDRHHVTDDAPYGGGGGMVLKPEPVFAAVEAVLGTPPNCPVILLTPQGRLFTQAVAMELAAPALEMASSLPERGADLAEEGPAGSSSAHLALICGRYEGIDERVRQYLVSDEISIGDYVLTGGELAALVLIDAISRLIPGVLGYPAASREDSHATGLLEYPHYTRPPDFRGWRVPEVLLSGDHARIARWRRQQALLRTWQRRPDLLATASLSVEDRRFLEKLEAERRDRETG